MSLLKLENVTMDYNGKVKALDNVNLDVRSGTVHSLMGENGAGKSTLMKCLIGMYTPDEGTVELAGDIVRFKDTKDGLEHGISMIHQELSPVPEMMVAENIWLGREPRGLAQGTRQARAGAELACGVDARWAAQVRAVAGGCWRGAGAGQRRGGRAGLGRARVGPRRRRWRCRSKSCSRRSASVSRTTGTW